MKKPRIFLSSTIYDFKDLRSSIKYYLEENGFDVQASETTNFDVDTTCHSYEACLNNIATCQYFILFIGGRKGGLYDKEKNISITQAEYRRAYELAKNDKLKLLCFVRKEIYDIRIDRKSISKNIESPSLNTTSSPLINDPDYVFSFIDEVSKNAETIKGEKPVANWIFQFNDFRDILSVLKNTLSLNVDINTQIWKENIKREIAFNFRFLFAGKNFSPTFSLWKIEKEKFEHRGKTIKLTGHEVWCMRYYEYFNLHQLRNLETHIMKESLMTEVFFDYSLDSKALIPNNVFLAIEKLIAKITKFKQFYHLYESSYMKTFHSVTQPLNPIRNDHETIFEFDYDMIYILASLAFLHIDITNFHISLLRTLTFPNEQSADMEEYIEYSLNSEENKKIKEENLSYNDALIYVNHFIDSWQTDKNK